MPKKLTVRDALLRNRDENESLHAQAKRLGLPDSTLRDVVDRSRKPRTGTKLQIEIALGRKPGSLVA